MCLTIEPVVDGVAAGLAFPCDVVPADAVPLRRLSRWRAELPTVTSHDPRLAAVMEQSLVDLAGLRIVDRAHPERVVIAAGAPWFMTLFGRDSLLTAWMTLPFDGTLAGGVLSSLAELQGTVDDPTAEEQPGKILHELRRHGGGGPFASRERYYGTVDATPLFVMLAAEAWRWGALSAIAARAARRRRWIRRSTGCIGAGDSDGDGFIDYHRRDATGLSNQGWKDSWDGITSADGSLPRDRSRSSRCRATPTRRSWGRRAGRADGALRHCCRPDPASGGLRDRFNERFWDSRGWYALALDGRRSGRRLLDDEPRPRALGRDRRRGACEPVPRPADGGGHVDGLGAAHARQHHVGLRPAQLPQRVGLAARHRDLRRRAPLGTAGGTSSIGSSTARWTPPQSSTAGPPSCSRGWPAATRLRRSPTPPRARLRPGRPRRCSCS